MKRLLLATAAACGLALMPNPALAEDAPVAPIDPASLAAAQTTVDHVFPAGTYARMMDKTMNGVVGTMMDGVGKLPLRELAAAGGVPQDKLDQLGDATLKEIMTIYDPHYEERTQLSMRAMMGEIGKLVSQFEPAVRDGLRRAYARRFSASQLGELNRFFATPTGKAYAADSLMVFMDPEVMTKMTEMMPAMLKQMPEITKKLEAATSKLPPPRKLEDLTPAERDKLAKLIGVPADELDKPADAVDAGN